MMAENSRMYDFSKFEVTMGSAAPQLQPQQEEPKKQKSAKLDLVQLTKKQLEKSRRPKIHPLKAAMYTLTSLVVVTIFSWTIYNQVQLTELTEKISTESVALEKAKALEVELGIKIAEGVNAVEIEDYARNELGMAKMNDQQIYYVNMVHEDKGEVLEKSETSFFVYIWEKIQSWFH